MYPPVSAVRVDLAQYERSLRGPASLRADDASALATAALPLSYVVVRRDFSRSRTGRLTDPSGGPDASSQTMQAARAFAERRASDPAFENVVIYGGGGGGGGKTSTRRYSSS